MSLIPLLGANLAVVVLESFLYGIYVILALFTLCLMVTRHRERRSKLLSPVTLGALALFVMVTSHWTLNVARLFLAFRQREDGPGPQDFYSDLSHRTELLKYGFFIAALSIGDAFLIHRLWAVWAFRTRIIIFPVIMLAGFIVFGVGMIYQLSMYNPTESIFRSSFRRWQTGICFFTLCTAAYTSGLVWYKLWTTSRLLKSVGVSSLNTIIKIFIESTAWVAIWGLFHVVSYQCGSNLQFVAIDCTPAVVGISDLLVNIRLHWDLTDKCGAGSGGSAPTQQMRFALTDLEASQCDVDGVNKDSPQL